MWHPPLPYCANGTNVELNEVVQQTDCAHPIAVIHQVQNTTFNISDWSHWYTSQQTKRTYDLRRIHSPCPYHHAHVVQNKIWRLWATSNYVNHTSSITEHLPVGTSYVVTACVQAPEVILVGNL